MPNGHLIDGIHLHALDEQPQHPALLVRRPGLQYCRDQPDLPDGFLNQLVKVSGTPSRGEGFLGKLEGQLGPASSCKLPLSGSRESRGCVRRIPAFLC